jgi:hypothetical protein
MTYEGDSELDDGHDRGFAAAVRDSLAVDPLPTIRALAESAGIPESDIMHFALVRWASAGSEALLTLEPSALQELIAARVAQDWPKVAGMIDWLAAGMESDRWR